jgi:hypothetical protein
VSRRSTKKSEKQRLNSLKTHFLSPRFSLVFAFRSVHTEALRWENVICQTSFLDGLKGRKTEFTVSGQG